MINYILADRLWIQCLAQLVQHSGYKHFRNQIAVKVSD